MIFFYHIFKINLNISKKVIQKLLIIYQHKSWSTKSKIEAHLQQNKIFSKNFDASGYEITQKH